MARQRFIHPDFWTDPSIGKLTPAERLFFIGCFSNADDEGRLLGDPAFLRSTIFPYDDIKLADIQTMRDRVISVCSNLDLYEADGVIYLSFARWSRYQSPRYPKPSKLPPPPNNASAAANSNSNTPDATLQPNGSNPDAAIHHRVGLGRVGMGSSSSRGDEETTTATTTTADADYARVTDFWQTNGFGIMAPLTSEKLRAYVDDGLEVDLVLWALEEAVAAGSAKQNLAYVVKILERCTREKITTRKQAEAQGKVRSGNSRDTPAKPKTVLDPYESKPQIQLGGAKRG